MNAIIHLLNEYGYIVLFLSLMLELIILPIPNEALMSYVGVLCYQGKMNLILSIISAGFGGMIGVTVSYWIGYKLGAPFFRKYGHFIHMGPEKMDKMEIWYQKYGKILLIFSYFIPGVRHIASIISGVIKLPFRSFSIFANIGVLLWISTFIWLGNVLGPKYHQYESAITKWLVLGSIVFAFLALIYFIVRTNRVFIKESMFLIFQSVFHKYNSLLKIKFVLLTFLIIFITFFSLMIGIIQDLVSNEFGKFNSIFKTIVFSLINVNYEGLIKFVYFFSSWASLLTISLFTVAAILLNRKNKWLELSFYVSILIATFLFSKGIHWLFNFMFSSIKIAASIPFEQSMLLFSVYGLFYIMLIRHRSNLLFAVGMFIFFIGILTGYSISAVYLFHFTPSDIMIGFVFSAVLVSGSILSMEMFRFLSLIKEGIRLEKIS